MAERLRAYVAGLEQRARLDLREAELFAKVLTRNDDSGRHGVLVPGEAYSFFPELKIPDPLRNETLEFEGYLLDGLPGTLAYKYYQRYPERRITRLPGLINSDSAYRVVVFVRGRDSAGQLRYVFDAFASNDASEFGRMADLLFGAEAPREAGSFIRRLVDTGSFQIDETLAELLDRFDRIAERGWIASLRGGDTGVGHTFESLVGVKENNDKTADFRGIELKCKLAREGAEGGGKINLFQQAPIWSKPMSQVERIRHIGKRDEDGLFRCYSMVTANANNLDLRLDVSMLDRRIRLDRQATEQGYWPFMMLQGRLDEKHSRAVFVKADRSVRNGAAFYRYRELVYCERPSIDEFIRLVQGRQIVFEFLMHEKPAGGVRNHGYPWRLMHESLLAQLFRFQLKLR